MLRKIDAISQASISGKSHAYELASIVLPVARRTRHLESGDANEAAILHDKLRQAVGPLLEALRSGRVITSVARNPDGFPLENGIEDEYLRERKTIVCLGNGDDAQSTIFEDKLRQAVGPLIEALRAARI